MRTTVTVPATLLLDSGLSASAKLVWMIMRLNAGQRPVNQASLWRYSGVAKETIRLATAKLVAAGWYEAPVADSRWVTLPLDLLEDRRLGAQARVLYGIVQLTPGFCNGSGQFYYADMSAIAHLSHNTVKRAVRDLAAVGWLEITQENQHTPIHFTLRNPVAEIREADLDRIKERLEGVRFHGEALMRECLSLLIPRRDFQDEATLGDVVSPLSDVHLRFDRLYGRDVAFEFNGPQHTRATEKYSEQVVSHQRMLDYAKRGMCQDAHIKLIVITPEELSLDVIRQKIGDSLPLRDLTGYERTVEYLENETRRYRNKVRRAEWNAPPRTPH